MFLVQQFESGQWQDDESFEFEIEALRRASFCLSFLCDNVRIVKENNIIAQDNER